MNRFPILTPLATASSVLAAVALGGCDREGIRVYSVAKESPAVAANSTSQPPQPAASAPAIPQVAYTLPTGWKDDGPNQMSPANFRITSPAGDAIGSITPLGNLAGKESMVINMLRNQFGLEPLDDAKLAATLESVQIGSDKGQLFEISDQREKDGIHVATAFAHHDGISWFYKIQGSQAAVAALKPAFLDLLKSVRFKEGAPSTTAAVEPPEAEPNFQWKVPEGWTKQPPGQMQVAKFSVQKDAAKAEVSVSTFPSDTGGMLANVNRWRRQLGLEAVDEAGLTPLVLGIPGVAGGQLVDLKNDQKALLGAIIPREGTWWFYKLMGDAPAVNAEREAFVRFVQTAP
jgi:hypothetical protein